MGARTPLPTRHALGFALGCSLVLGAAAPITAQDEAAEPLTLTPPQAEGPYYPVEIPADHDSDLTIVGDSEAVAIGLPLVLEGVVLDSSGQPVDGAVVEIWQTDALGVYLHPGDPGFAGRDPGFQGFGVSPTDAMGAWSFRTILPEVYGNRPRHIHAKVKVDDETLLTTQIYFSTGDIPLAGSIEPTGSELDALLVEVRAETAEDGVQVLRAEHRLVVPEADAAPR